MIRTNYTRFESFKIRGKQFLALINYSQCLIYSNDDGKIAFYGSYYSPASFRVMYAKDGESLKL